MKLTGYKRLEKAPRLTASQLWAFVPVCLMFFLLGANCTVTPLKQVIFDLGDMIEYSGMAVTAIIIGLVIGIPISVFNDKYRRYVVAAMIAFVLGCLISLLILYVANPGELITGA